MATSISSPAKSSLKIVEWMWKENPNPLLKSEKIQWKHYSDVENLIIERAFNAKQSKVELDDCYIDFARNLQVSNTDKSQRIPVQRLERKREDKHLRESRFVDLPVTSDQCFGREYGWVSPFVIEVRRHLNLKPNELPSKKPSLIPMLVKKAAQGIIDEGTKMKKRHEAEELARILIESKNLTIEEVWQCCAYLYTLESFLFRTLNATMRLVGDPQQEEIWRSKVPTLGPFCLLLWDDPININLATKKTLYRGAYLERTHIARYQQMTGDENAWGSFQAFASCSRDRKKAAEFGNTLFIFEVLFAFIADISQLSEYECEEEELIAPGVCFRVKKVEFDPKIKKHFITMELRQRFSSK